MERLGKAKAMNSSRGACLASSLRLSAVLLRQCSRTTVLTHERLYHSYSTQPLSLDGQTRGNNRTHYVAATVFFAWHVRRDASVDVRYVGWSAVRVIIACTDHIETE